MPGVGTATLDFGAAPGTNITSVTVTGQGAISTTSHAEAFFMGDTTADHNDTEHLMAPLAIKLTCGIPSAGAGFPITALTEHRLTGTFKCHWVWSD